MILINKYSQLFTYFELVHHCMELGISGDYRVVYAREHIFFLKINGVGKPQKFSSELELDCPFAKLLCLELFAIHGILFAIKSIRAPTTQFSITDYINFNSTNTRSDTSNKLTPTHHLNNLSLHSYFYRLPSLWNTMPVLIQICLLLHSNLN